MSRGREIEVLARPASASDLPERIEGRSIADWRAEARASLGLPEGPLFACGHQCEAWHPGILAKNLWVQVMAERRRGHAVHAMVDQDGFDGLRVEWPERGPDGHWRVRSHRFGPEGGPRMAMRCATFQPRAADPGPGAATGVAEGLARLHAALQAARRSSDAAEQATRAMLAAASDVLPEPRICRASSLMATSLGRRLLDRMLEDPAACAAAFNEALAESPRAARPLRERGRASELPVWTEGAAGERARPSSDEVRAAVDGGRAILPRAFLMGALLRTAVADRFVHGIGGGDYERVTDRWLRRWLGWSPPHFDVVSANLRLPLEMPTPPDHQGMPWRQAWCDPELLAVGGHGPSASRRRLLDLIAAVPRGDPRRKSIYRELLVERDAARLRRSGELESLQAAEAAAGARRLALELAARRTWCLALQPPTALSDLRDAVRSRAPAA